MENKCSTSVFQQRIHLEMKIYAVIPILHNAIIIIFMGNVRDTSGA